MYNKFNKKIPKKKSYYIKLWFSIVMTKNGNKLHTIIIFLKSKWCVCLFLELLG